MAKHLVQCWHCEEMKEVPTAEAVHYVMLHELVCRRCDDILSRGI